MNLIHTPWGCNKTLRFSRHERRYTCPFSATSSRDSIMPQESIAILSHAHVIRKTGDGRTTSPKARL